MPIQDATIAAVVALAAKVGVDGVEHRRRAAPGRPRARLRRVRRPAARRVARRHPGRLGLGRDDLGADRRFDGAGGGQRGCGPGLPDGLRLPHAARPRSAPRRRWPAATAPSRICRGRSTCTPRPACRSQQTILGLPLYGTRWRVEGPELGSPRLGDGAIWVPADNPKFLASPPAPPELDPIEIVEHYAVAPTVEPAARRFARDGRLAGDLCRLAGDPHAEARAGRRPGPRRRRLLGHRLRARAPRLYRPDRHVRRG